MIVVFDLDGTLVDSARDIAASANELVTSLGGRSLDLADVTMMVGDGAAVLVKRALREGGVDPETPNALPRFLQIYERRLLETTTVYPGMRETLALLSRRARLAVLTNKPQAHSERLLQQLGILDFFERVIGGDGPFGKKPEPNGMLSLVADVAPSGTLLVGDSPVDFETAVAAGSGFAWARYGFGSARFGSEPPDTPYILDTPQDLPPVVERLAAIFSGA
jgi:phosphoglycolate phosphatase